MLFSLLNIIQWLTAAFKIKYKLLHRVNKTHKALQGLASAQGLGAEPLNIEKIMEPHFLVPSPIHNEKKSETINHKHIWIL